MTRHRTFGRCLSSRTADRGHYSRGVTDRTVSSPLWRERRFATYWTGQAISEFGDRISELALPLIAVTMLSASAGEIGVLTAAVWAPNLMSLLIGSWVDHRPSKRRLLIAADLFRFLVVASIPLAYTFDAITLGQLFVVALLAGTGGVLY